MPDVALLIGGSRHGGWTSVRVRRGLDQPAGSFELEFTDVWREGGQSTPLKPGDACQLELEGDVVIDGYLDDVGESYSAQHHTMSAAGRSKVADLVDCSAVHGTGQWIQQGLVQIAADLLRPFALRVDVAEGVDVGEPFRRYRIEFGESVLDCIERAARMRGVLVVAGPQGITFTRAGRTRVRTTIVRSGVLSGRRNVSHRDRFSDYLTRGRAAGDDEWSGDVATQQDLLVLDPDVDRYRPLLIQSEGEGGKADLERRATWERGVRMGRSVELRYTLPMWSHDDGLWEPNTLVAVDDDWLGVKGEFLVESVELSLGDEGTRAELSLVDPLAYSVQVA